MKFQVSFKTPYVLKHALEQASYDPDAQCDCGGSCVDCDRLSEIANNEAAAIIGVASKFIQYDECITIEFDTEAGTATVVQIRK
jgi:hypothetical protein